MGVDRGAFAAHIQRIAPTLEAHQAKELATELMSEYDISPRQKVAQSSPQAVQDAARRGFYGGEGKPGVEESGR